MYLKQEDGSQKKRALIQIQRGLIRSQELGDEKLQMVSLIVEFIENRTRQLEQDLENLGMLFTFHFIPQPIQDKQLNIPLLSLEENCPHA